MRRIQEAQQRAMPPARTLREKADLDAAIEGYRKAVQRMPGEAAPRLVLANALLGRGLSDAALVQYQEAVHLAPSNVEAYTLL